MAGTDTHPIPGLDAAREEIMKIKAHKLSYTIFEISQLDPVAFRVVHSDGLKDRRDHRALVTQDELLKTFDACKSKMQPKQSYFIAYDFGYYNELNNFREMVVLISFVSESENLRKKIIMASNTSEIQKHLDLSMLVEIHDFNDLTYEKLKSECAMIQRK